MFKVVTDQLKVSQGWVRCGHCAEVFDASLHLQAVPTPDVSASYAPEPVPVESAAHTESVQAPQSASLAELPEAPEMQKEDAELQALDCVVPDSVSELPELAPDAAHDVSFVRDARRQAFWRKPSVRLALGLVGCVLTVLLLLQFAVQQRDNLAALDPKLKPWLQKMCEQLQCEIGPLRHIEAVVIDSSSFNKINADLYRLSFSLKNTGPTAVAMPSLEVTLTDTQDQALVRRVLTPAQFGVLNGMVGAGADYAGLVVMQVLGSEVSGVAVATPASTAAGPLRVAGYRVLAFYP